MRRFSPRRERRQTMNTQEELLETARSNAWSSSEAPRGRLIGQETSGSKTYYFYQEETEDGPVYWYETDYDREMRKKEREQRFRKRNRR